MTIKSAEFLKSFERFDQMGVGDLEPRPEFAFVGRSNVGKSSLLNMLCNSKKLAVTSQTPGRTRLINFFNIRLGSKEDEQTVYFVDLPGYGFSAAGKGTTQGWSQSITEYLTKSENLRRVFVLVDIRHEPSGLDEAMLNFLQSHSIPFKIIATKCDKFSRAQMNLQRLKISQSIGIGKDDIILTSASSKLGREDILMALNTKI